MRRRWFVLVGFLGVGLAFLGCGVENVDPYFELPPVIADVRFSTQFSPSGLTVQWKTDQESTSRLDYMTPTTMTNTVDDRILTTEHSAFASQITTPADYVLNLQSTNARGQTSTLTVFLPRNSPVFVNPFQPRNRRDPVPPSDVPNPLPPLLGPPSVVIAPKLR